MLASYALPVMHGMSWAAGAFFGLVFGHLATRIVFQLLEYHTRLPARYEARRVPPALVGVFERSLFGALVAYGVPGSLSGMAVWVGLKMAANWNSRETGDANKEGHRALLNRRFIALVCNAVSMAFAGIAGVIVMTNTEWSLPAWWWAGAITVALVLVASAFDRWRLIKRLRSMEKRLRVIETSLNPNVGVGQTKAADSAGIAPPQGEAYKPPTTSTKMHSER